MKNRRLLALTLTALVAGTLAAGNDEDRDDRSAPEGLDPAKVEAALVFAEALTDAKDGDRVRVFKMALEMLYEAEWPTPDSTFDSRGSIDLDPRYQRNLLQMLEQPQMHIWGGVPAADGLHDDAVLILGGGSYCTGTLIAPDVVLTAAHCYWADVKEKVVFGESVRRPRGTIGVQRVESFVSREAHISSGDLALMFLEKETTVKPRSLALSEWIDAAVEIRAVGFGGTERRSEGAGVKRVVDIPVASSDCTGTVSTREGLVEDSEYYGCAPKKELVAGRPRLGRDICKGDSGGPVYVRGPEGRLHLAAVSSRNVPRTSGYCGDGAVYVRVDGEALEWIQRIVAGRATAGND